MITLSVPVYYFIVTLHKSNLIDSGNNYLHQGDDVFWHGLSVCKRNSRSYGQILVTFSGNMDTVVQMIQLW